MPIHLLLHRLSVAAVALLGPLRALAEARALPDGLYAEITTPRGVITCELDYTRAPLTVASFVGLAEGTLGPAPRKPFFDGLTFHRVVPHFVIQGGDPLGTGEGGPGYMFPDEFAPGLTNDQVGALSMANEGPDTNGSQFFLTLSPVGRLDYLHTVFGRTVRGVDVLPQVAQGDAMRVHILRVGAAAQAFAADDAAFAALRAHARAYAAEKEPGPKAHFDDPDRILPMDPPRAQAFTYKLANVQRSTGQRIYARIFTRFTPGPAGADPDAFAAGLADALGLAENGVLALYFQDRDAWTVHVGRSGPIGLAGKIPDLLAAARVRQARYLAQSQQVNAQALQAPGAKTKVATDAVLDELISHVVLPK